MKSEGQCQTVYVAHWLQSWHDQVDIKRRWTQEKFDNSKVYYFLEAYFDCETENCADFPANLKEKLINDANQIISEGLEPPSKYRNKTYFQKEASFCFVCNAEAFEIDDSKLNGIKFQAVTLIDAKDIFFLIIFFQIAKIILAKEKHANALRANFAQPGF